MKIRIDKTYPIPAAPEAAWDLLRDLEAVAGCMPGAKITERLDEDRFKGTVAVKVGPASMTFRGEVAMKEVDAEARSLRLAAKGTDTTGSSAASMDLAARIEPAEAGACALVGGADVSMSGKASNFGARMMTGVADQVLQQFAANFARQLAQRAAPSPAREPSPSPSGARQGEGVGEGRGEGNATPPPPANELNGLAVLWAAFKAWLRGLVTRKPA